MPPAGSSMMTSKYEPTLPCLSWLLTLYLRSPLDVISGVSPSSTSTDQLTLPPPPKPPFPSAIVPPSRLGAPPNQPSAHTTYNEWWATSEHRPRRFLSLPFCQEKTVGAVRSK